MTKQLKIMALDAEDLLVLSAHVQDAVLKSGQIEYLSSEKTLVLPVNRFAWEAKPERKLFSKTYQRRQAVLQFGQVENLRSQGVDRTDQDQVLSLLAIEFDAAENLDDPSGTVRLMFSGRAAMHFNVECIEAKLTDFDAAWEASGKPRHQV